MFDPIRGIFSLNFYGTEGSGEISIHEYGGEMLSEKNLFWYCCCDVCSGQVFTKMGCKRSFLCVLSSAATQQTDAAAAS